MSLTLLCISKAGDARVHHEVTSTGRCIFCGTQFHVESGAYDLLMQRAVTYRAFPSRQDKA